MIEYDIEFTIIQGRDLIAKDRNIITRQRTTSDPYVDVFLGIDHKLGRTITIEKTCNPIFHSTFCFRINGNNNTKKATKKKNKKKQNNNNGNNNNRNGTVIGVLFLKIYDEDVITDPDLMGTLTVPIRFNSSQQNGAGQQQQKQQTTTTTTRTTHTEWLPVDDTFVYNATGQIEVQFNIKANRSIIGNSNGPFGCFTNPENYMPSPQTVARWMKNGMNLTTTTATTGGAGTGTKNNNNNSNNNNKFGATKQEKDDNNATGDTTVTSNGGNENVIIESSITNTRRDYITELVKLMYQNHDRRRHHKKSISNNSNGTTTARSGAITRSHGAGGGQHNNYIDDDDDDVLYSKSLSNRLNEDNTDELARWLIQAQEGQKTKIRQRGLVGVGGHENDDDDDDDDDDDESTTTPFSMLFQQQ